MNQFPCEHDFADRDGPAPECLPRSGPPLNHGRMAIEFDQLVAVEQPQKTGIFDPGEGALPIASK